jgi:hypothetical protein
LNIPNKCSSFAFYQPERHRDGGHGLSAYKRL